MNDTTESKPWFSNETKVGLGLAGAALGTLGIFAIAVKFSKSTKEPGAYAVTNMDIPRGGRGDVVPMKTMQVTLSMEVPEDFSKREIDALLARLKVVADPGCRYLGVDAVGEPWGTPARVR